MCRYHCIRTQSFHLKQLQEDVIFLAKYQLLHLRMLVKEFNEKYAINLIAQNMAGSFLDIVSCCKYMYAESNSLWSANSFLIAKQDVLHY